RLLNLPVREDARLCEIHMGEWQGQNYREVVTRFKAAGNHLAQVCAPGGEPVAAVARRMTGCVTDIALAHPGARVLIFSHGLALSALICTARRIPLEQVYEHIPRNGKADVITWPPAPDGLIQMPTC
ncbi:MAG: histidine phosphatase family protein, partial [Anaerolineae bacterium]|nr:histidine phosphatase family protein [Anaerolineae bacterium]